MLVTHHVELVLPGAEYLVRMLDGRIDLQGYVKDLRAAGKLDSIALDNLVDEEKEDDKRMTSVEDEIADNENKDPNNVDVSAPSNTVTKVGGKKKARKLVADEERETGGVKWSIYKTYLKASYVLVFLKANMRGDTNLFCLVPIGHG